MSERSRRRRRRRRANPATDAQRRLERETPEGQPIGREQAPPAGRSRRRRRGRGRGGQDGVSSPKSSEDLVRALPRERPAKLTAPPDGQTLEGLIGDLQSEYGVPQYPQEYRITMKVAEERDRTERPASEESATQVAPAPPAQSNGGPRREKAPAMTSDGPSAREQATGGMPRKRSRRRRRRRGSGGGGSDGPGGAPTQPS